MAINFKGRKIGQVASVISEPFFNVPPSIDVPFRNKTMNDHFSLV